VLADVWARALSDLFFSKAALCLRYGEAAEEKYRERVTRLGATNRTLFQPGRSAEDASTAKDYYSSVSFGQSVRDKERLPYFTHADPTTSFSALTGLSYATGAGITAAAGTRLALQ